MKTAIIAVAYNRVDSLKRLLTSLENASYPEQVTLIVSVDKSNTDEVENFVDSYSWKYGDYRVIKHDKNLGLRLHILSLGKYFDEFDTLIVLEDDLTVAPSFYHYATACVEKYHDDHHIAGISLYAYTVNFHTNMPFSPAKSQYDVYMMNIAMSWGQVWMKQQWKEFLLWYEGHSEDFHLEHLPQSINEWPKSSWLKYHIRYCIEENKYFVYPYYSLSTNNADPGVNFDTADTLFQANMLLDEQKEFRLPDFNQCEVRYDGFYQPKFLGKYLDVEEEELCVDLFSDKPACLLKKYLLSSRLLPYKVLKSFALQLRPIELNIICKRDGGELFLYDTSQADKAPNVVDKYAIYTYFYQKGFYKARTMIGLRRSLSLLFEMIPNKIHMLFHR